MNKEFTFYQLPAILCVLLIYFGSSIPAQDFPDLSIFNYDKVIHFLLYFVLSFLTYRALRHQTRIKLLSKHAHWIAFLFAMAYGASDEYHQSFVPGRDSDPFDWLADTMGALACFLVVYRRSVIPPKDQRSLKEQHLR
jgi:VanZ family protein